jgi:hypothetical protein
MNVSPWCKFIAAKITPCLQGAITMPVSSDFTNFEESLLAALKTDPPHISLDLL